MVKIKNEITLNSNTSNTTKLPMHDLAQSVVSYDTQSVNSTAPEPKFGKGKYSLTALWKIGVK